jgi:hypothetical protein
MASMVALPKPGAKMTARSLFPCPEATGRATRARICLAKPVMVKVGVLVLSSLPARKSMRPRLSTSGVTVIDEDPSAMARSTSKPISV